MFTRFFYELKAAGVPVTLKEYLVLLEGLQAGLARFSVEDFYYLARTTLIKDERFLDRFDRVFGQVFKGLESEGEEGVALPAEWLKKLAELHLTPEEMAKIEALGGFEEIMKALAERLKEQKDRHQGGNRWIGTAGTSPFGAWGYNPAGVRIGQQGSRHRRAIKVWDRREFRNLDDDEALSRRNIQVALRRLRRFARIGAPSELDLDATIKATAKQGWLDLKLRPERHNAVNVLLMLDVGGSMDDHVELSRELFAAARSEFKHLEFFYFHNCVYESVWKDNRRRHEERIATADILHRYPAHYRLIFVGDASMAPYEITHPGGSVEHWNEEPGAVWLKRLLAVYHKAVWLNPVPEEHWDWTPSIGLIRELMEDRMFPLTPEGLERAMRTLS
ncbi:MAG: VWA domain-containing protein [Rhodothalassiaceae bacterium]|nr:MAG: VWA domain-containing protein [Rhodothalassiaceae bacterium]